MKPKRFLLLLLLFFMVNMASDIARGSVLSPTVVTVAWRKHAGLVNVRVHISLMTLDIHVN